MADFKVKQTNKQKKNHQVMSECLKHKQLIKRYATAMTQVQGQPSLNSCVIIGSIKTARAADRRGHTGQFVYANQAFVFSEDVLLNERRRVEA